jgi:predicted urease superfamily metal-dependent hydrolase
MDGVVLALETSYRCVQTETADGKGEVRRSHSDNNDAVFYAMAALISAVLKLLDNETNDRM